MNNHSNDSGRVRRRSGTVAIIGRSNVGKSTLLNAALELDLAIVSRKPQTTRDRLLGVVRHGDAELALLDTPGLHQAQTRLGKTMNRVAREAVRAADVVVLLVALPRRVRVHHELRPHRGDVSLAEQIAVETPTVLAINKIDLLPDKRYLLPLIDAFAAVRSFEAIVPISALQADGVNRVLDEVAKLLPEADYQHAADEITDRPLRFFAAEYVREPILDATKQEVPHAVAVHIDQFVEPVGDGPLFIAATIVVERTGQKRILIGTQGAMLKRIGQQARARMEQLVGRQVVLKLWVRVARGWRNSPRQLAELGYGGADTGGTKGPTS